MSVKFDDRDAGYYLCSFNIQQEKETQNNARGRRPLFLSFARAHV